MTYKNIRIKKKGGGYRTQRVQVLSNGKYKFVKNLNSKSKKTTNKIKKTVRRVSLPRRNRKRNGKRKFTIPIAPIAGIIAAPATQQIAKYAMAGNFEQVLKTVPNYIGFWSDGSFHWDYLVKNVGAMAAGALVHKFVGGAPLNLNKTLANAGVPFIRI